MFDSVDMIHFVGEYDGAVTVTAVQPSPSADSVQCNQVSIGDGKECWLVVMIGVE